MSHSVHFVAVAWAALEACPPGERPSFLWRLSPAGKRAVRELRADPRLENWKYAFWAGSRWEEMRQALDEQARRDFDPVLGALFWERPCGLRQALPDVAGTTVALSADDVVDARAGWIGVASELEGLEPFFLACCLPGEGGGRIETFEDFRTYVDAWGRLLDELRAGEGLVGRA